MISEDSIISRGQGLLEAGIDGEMVALHIERGTCYGFNGTATRVWALIEQPKPLAEITDVLTREYEVERDQCETELNALLADLQSEGLIEISPPAA
jgi:hypothetical protein